MRCFSRSALAASCRATVACTSVKVEISAPIRAANCDAAAWIAGSNTLSWSLNFECGDPGFTGFDVQRDLLIPIGRIGLSRLVEFSIEAGEVSPGGLFEIGAGR